MSQGSFGLKESNRWRAILGYLDVRMFMPPFARDTGSVARTQPR